MTKKQRAAAIVQALELEYPEAICSLDYEEPYRLLVAARLAAQCTDARVNKVTPVLFGRYPTIEDLAGANVADVIEIVRPCGLGNTKARDIVEMCGLIITRHRGILPDEIEQLLELPGVGRKTANLIIGDVYGKPAIVCDTHCIRITNLMGLVSSKNPLIVERQLRDILCPEKSNDFCHRLVLHGRAVCKARSPDCPACCAHELCATGKKQ